MGPHPYSHRLIMEILQLGRQAFLAVGLFSLSFFYHSEVRAQVLSAQPPSTPCVLTVSKNLPPSWSEWLHQVISERLQNSCDQRSIPVLEPFREIRSATDFPADAIFIFWAEKDSRTEELQIRVFDPESRLQWTMTKVKIEGLSEASAKTVLADALNQTLLQFPFAGTLKDGRIYTWSTFDSLKLAIADRQEVERHPFLPQVLKFPYALLPEAKLSLSRNSGGQWIIKGEGKRIKAALTGEKKRWLLISAR